MTTYRNFLIPMLLILIGLVILFAGREEGGRFAGRILVVILGAIALFLVFGYIVGRAI